MLAENPDPAACRFDHGGFRAGATPPAVYDRGRLIISLAELGRFAEATEFEAETLRLAAQTQHAYTVGWAHLTASWVHLLRGDWARASPGVEHMRRRVLEDGGCRPPAALRGRPPPPGAWRSAATRARRSSRLREGEQLLERHALSGQTGTLGWFYAGLGRAAPAAGPAGACAAPGRLVRSSSRRANPDLRPMRWQLLGDVAAHPDQLDAKRAARPTIAMRSALPSRAACARSSPTATSASASSTGTRAAVRADGADEHLDDGDDDVPRDGHAVLGRSRPEAGDAPERPSEPMQACARGGLRRAGTGAQRPVASRTPLPPTPAPTMVGEKPSIAVLPFQNMSGDPEQDYFADGVTEDIITALSRFHELVVIARGSSFAFKGKGLTLRQIAGQLGVQYVLSGSMRKAGNRIRVSAELTHAGSDVQVWSDRYDRALVDVFDLQDDISRTVAAVVEPAVRDAEIERARRKPPARSFGVTTSTCGRFPIYGPGPAATSRRRPSCFDSLRLDPTRTTGARGAGLGLVMASPLGSGCLRRRRNRGASAWRAAPSSRTVPTLSPRPSTASRCSGRSARTTQGRIHAKEAVRLNPSSAFAWGVLGMIDSMAGRLRERHRVRLDRSLVLSPYDNMLHLWMTGLTSACFALGRHEEGVTWARKSVQHNPGNGTGHRMLAANLAAAGRIGEARDVTRQRDAANDDNPGAPPPCASSSKDEVLERYLAAQRMAGVSE